MISQLTTAIVDIREGLAQGDFRSEAAISRGIVMRLLAALDWPPFDPQIVSPEYQIGNRKVDYALCHPRGKATILIEVKDVGKADEKGERQLFEYCFHQGVPIAVLTDGRTWKFFFPAGQGTYGDRCFAEMDIVAGDENEIASMLVRYLAYEEVKSGRARRKSERDYEVSREQGLAASSYASIWKELLSEPDDILINLFSEKVEQKSGIRPDKQRVTTFLKGWTTQSPAVPPKPITPRPRPVPPRLPDDARPSFAIDGQIRTFRTAKEVLVEVFRELSRRDRTFCERYERQFPGRKNPYLARRKEDLFPNPKLAYLIHTDAHSLPGGLGHILVMNRKENGSGMLVK